MNRFTKEISQATKKTYLSPEQVAMVTAVVDISVEWIEGKRDFSEVEGLIRSPAYEVGVVTNVAVRSCLERIIGNGTLFAPAVKRISDALGYPPIV